MRGHLELPSEQRLCSRRPETHDGARLDELDFRIEPRPARRNFAGVWLFVDPAFATRLPLEVLHDVGHVDGVAIDARFLERAVEQTACGPDKRPPREIF